MASSSLVVATRNPGKVREIRRILSDLDIEVLSLSDCPGVEAPRENGLTFEENATIKATHAALSTGLPALADDSGLEVDALGGDPGVHSARFAGDDATDEANNRKLIGLLRGIPPERRTARFRCAVVVCSAAGEVETVSAACEGVIVLDARGSGGFGYDPLFLVPSLGKTFAELATGDKNVISHRGKALALARPLILKTLGLETPVGES